MTIDLYCIIYLIVFMIVLGPLYTFMDGQIVYPVCTCICNG